MKKSVFNLSKLGNLQTAVKGVKASNDIRPEILTGRAINKFTLSGSASSTIGVEDGDNLVIFSMPDADSVNEKYFVAKCAEGNGVKLGSANHAKGAGKPLNFNYAGIWSEIIQNDTTKTDAIAIGEAAMVSKGYMVNEPTQLQKDTKEQLYSNLSLYRIGYEVKPVLGEDGQPVQDIEIGGVVYPELFVLENPIKYETDGQTQWSEKSEKAEATTTVTDGYVTDVATAEEEI